jgi:hypothetical protein
MPTGFALKKRFDTALGSVPGPRPPLCFLNSLSATPSACSGVPGSSWPYERCPQALPVTVFSAQVSCPVPSSRKEGELVLDPGLGTSSQWGWNSEQLLLELSLDFRSDFLGQSLWQLS